MLKLYCFPRSGNSREVKLVLAEKNIPFEPVNIHTDPTVKESPDFKKASPQGKVPAIVDGSVFMSEAFDINQYLDKKHPTPALMPADEAKKEEIRQFVKIYDKKLVLNIGLLVIECILKPKAEQKEEVKAKRREDIAAGIRDLEKMVVGKEYLFGAYSLADISVTPHIAALPMLGSAIPDDCPNMKSWFERIKARPSFTASAN